MGDLSAHFDSSEFRCKDGSTHAIDPALISKLETVRAQMGNHPIRIVSGYRSPAWNRRVGGARNSYHLRGMAADLVEGAVTRTVAVAAGFGGVGYRGKWAVHVDVRGGTPVQFAD